MFGDWLFFPPLSRWAILLRVLVIFLIMVGGSGLIVGTLFLIATFLTWFPFHPAIIAVVIVVSSAIWAFTEAWYQDEKTTQKEKKELDDMLKKTREY